MTRISLPNQVVIITGRQTDLGRVAVSLTIRTMVQYQAQGVQFRKGSGRVVFLPTQIVGQIGNLSLCVDAVFSPEIVGHYNKLLAKAPLK